MQEESVRTRVWSEARTLSQHDGSLKPWRLCYADVSGGIQQWDRPCGAAKKLKRNHYGHHFTNKTLLQH